MIGLRVATSIVMALNVLAQSMGRVENRTALIAVMRWRAGWIDRITIADKTVGITIDSRFRVRSR